MSQGSHRPAITVVSGLPRSGTSLMMQMLSAGGMPVLTDHLRQPDPDNPRGYFEYDAVRKTRRDSGWIADADGRAVKVVHVLLVDLPANCDYRVILMQRSLAEVLESQRIMLERAGKSGAGLPDARLAAIYTRQMEEIRAFLARQPNFTSIELDYGLCVTDPATAAATVNQFLGGNLEEERMALAVDASLYRNRRLPG